MLSQLKRQYRLARLVYRFVVREELSSPTPVSPRRRFGFVRRGYLSQSDVLYDLNTYPLQDYLSDMACARMSMMFDGGNVRAGYQYGVNNKFFSTALFGLHLRVPKVYAFIQRGQVVPVRTESERMFANGWRGACQAAGGVLVLKPNALGRGSGVFMVSMDGEQLLLDGRPVTEADVDQRTTMLDEYIVVEFLRQGAFAASLFPQTTNTIRMITMLDPQTNEPHLPIAVQRIGRSTSIPVDNWSRGGLCAEIDMETGALSRAVARETPQKTLAWYDEHPDTGTPIRGAVVPRWKEIRREVLSVAAKLPFYRFLSWDVITFDDGIGLIEADTVAGIETLQVHRPLLRDERLRSFFEHHGIVRKRAVRAGELVRTSEPVGPVA
jgi:hypothetical protein